jgi:hypothetical protein
MSRITVYHGIMHGEKLVNKQLPLSANVEQFLTVYMGYLAQEVKAAPSLYKWYDGTEDSLAKMRMRLLEALLSGKYSKDTPSIRRTLKALNIKPTYKAINEWLYVKESS